MYTSTTIINVAARDCYTHAYILYIYTTVLPSKNGEDKFNYILWLQSCCMHAWVNNEFSPSPQLTFRWPTVTMRPLTWFYRDDWGVLQVDSTSVSSRVVNKNGFDTLSWLSLIKSDVCRLLGCSSVALFSEDILKWLHEPVLFGHPQ